MKKHLTIFLFIFFTGIVGAENFYHERNDGSVVKTYTFEDESRTINFDTSMLTEEIQEKIDQVGKHIHSGTVLTFQFSDGTYQLTNSLVWEGFYGGGIINIQGNVSESNAGTYHTSQLVRLDGSQHSTNTLYLKNITAQIYIKNLAVRVGDSDYISAILIERCIFTDVWYCYLYATSKTHDNRALTANWWANCKSYYNYVSGINSGIHAQNSSEIFSHNTPSCGTNPNYGLRVWTAGKIFKWDGIQPTGDIVNELIHSGGMIQ